MSSQDAIGFWVLEGGGFVLAVFLLVGQTGALIDYELMVSLGLQESAGEITELGVVFNKAFAAADTVVYLPLLVIGLVGFWFAKQWGAIALAAALGITAYWPIVTLWALYGAKDIPGFSFSNHATYAVILVPCAIYSIWGLVYLCRGRRLTQQASAFAPR